MKKAFYIYELLLLLLYCNFLFVPWPTARKGLLFHKAIIFLAWKETWLQVLHWLSSFEDLLLPLLLSNLSTSLISMRRLWEERVSSRSCRHEVVSPIPGFTLFLLHGVWKSQKKSHSTLRAKRATFTFWLDKSWLKMPKMVQFGEFLKTYSLRSNSATRQVTFNMTKSGGKYLNSKIQMRHFE